MKNKISNLESTDLIVEEAPDQHPRQQKIYLRIDLGEGTIDVETCSQLQGESFYTYYGHARQFNLPNGVDASALHDWVDEKILPLAEELQGLYKSHWDGNNHVAIFLDEDRAEELINEISDLCINDPACLSGHAGFWDVEEWFSPVKSDLTNEVKDMTEEDIQAKVWDLITEAKADGVIFDGSVRDYLIRLQEEAKAQEDEDEAV